MSHRRRSDWPDREILDDNITPGSIADQRRTERLEHERQTGKAWIEHIRQQLDQITRKEPA